MLRKYYFQVTGVLPKIKDRNWETPVTAIRSESQCVLSLKDPSDLSICCACLLLDLLLVAQRCKWRRLLYNAVLLAVGVAAIAGMEWLMVCLAKMPSRGKTIMAPAVIGRCGSRVWLGRGGSVIAEHTHNGARRMAQGWQAHFPRR